MSTIWITGGKGFIGRYLAKFVAAEGRQVFGIGHGLWPIEEAAKWSYSHWCNGEIEPSNLDQLADVSGVPDMIYHLAGGSSVGLSFQNPYEDFSRNVAATARLLEWVRSNAVGAGVVATSSAAVYGSNHLGKISEHAHVAPSSPYGFHKAMMEDLCRSYGANFGIKVAVLRLFSVYGAGLEKQLIWDICSKLVAGQAGPMRLGGMGDELRDWLHVTDAVKLLWLIRSECKPSCGFINGGTGIGTKISEAAGLVCRAWGALPAIEFSGIARIGDPPSLVADISRATQLGFKSSMKFGDGILETVKWFKKNRGRPLDA